MRILVGTGRSMLKARRSGASAPSPFSPLSLNPTHWVKGDVGTYQSADTTTPSSADGDPVRFWQSQSIGNTHSISQGTSSKRPTLSVPGQNGLNVVSMDGVDDYLSVAYAASALTTLTVALNIVAPLVAENARGFWAWSENQTPSPIPWILFQMNGGDVRVFLNGYQYVIPHAAGVAKSYILRWTGGTTWKLRVNAVDQTPVTVDNSLYQAVTNTVFAGIGYSSYSATKICESLITESAISDDNTALLSTYLNRWGNT